jgi:chromosome partitioning protein
VRSVAIIQRLGRDGMIVLNQCAASRSGVEPPSVVKAFEALRFAGLPVTPAVLRSRLIYQTAFAQMRSVLEIDQQGSASAEVRELFAQVWRAIGGERRAPLRTANDDLRRPASRTGGLGSVLNKALADWLVF